MQLFGTKGQKFLHCPGTKGQQDKLKILPRDGTGRDSHNSGQRDRSSFIVPGQRDKLKILPRDGMGRDSQNPGRDGPGQPKTGTGRGTKRDRAEKDVLKQKKCALKQKRTF